MDPEAIKRLLQDPLLRSTLPLWHPLHQPQPQKDTPRGVPQEWHDSPAAGTLVDVDLIPGTFPSNTLHRESPDQQFVFQTDRLERNRWLELLPSLTMPPRVRERFEDCGSTVRVKYDASNKRYHLIGKSCRLRWCPRCRRRLQQAAAERIRNTLGQVKPRTWQFITLTMRHGKAPLVHQIKFLRESFRKLRQRKLWSKAVVGGYAVIEIGFNEKTAEWHPHLHVLAKCSYIDWAKLRADWTCVTHGSNVIDCRFVNSANKAADYVAKYVGKPPAFDASRHLDLADQYIAALRCGKLLIPFGKLPKRPPQLPIELRPPLEDLGPLADLRSAAAHGDETAARHLTALCQQLTRADHYYHRLQHAGPQPVVSAHDPPPF